MTHEQQPTKPWWQAVIHGGIIHAIHADVPDGPIALTYRDRYGPAACGAVGGNARIFLLALHDKTREAVPWGAPPWGRAAHGDAKCRACRRAVRAEQRANRPPSRLAQAIAALDAIDPSDDPEAAHGEADQVLLAHAPTELRDAYQRLTQRAPWWASA